MITSQEVTSHEVHQVTCHVVQIIEHEQE